MRRQYGVAGGGEVKIDSNLGPQGLAQTSDERTQALGGPLAIRILVPWSCATTMLFEERVESDNHRRVLLGNDIVQDCLGRRVLWDVGIESFLILLSARVSDEQAAARQHFQRGSCCLAVKQAVLEMRRCETALHVHHTRLVARAQKGGGVALLLAHQQLNRALSIFGRGRPHLTRVGHKRGHLRQD